MIFASATTKTGYPILRGWGYENTKCAASISEFTSNSIKKSTIDTVKAMSNQTSAGLEQNPYFISSPNKAKRVTRAIVIVTALPSNFSLI